MVDMVGDPDRVFDSSPRMPTFAHALAGDIAEDIAAVTPRHPRLPNTFAVRAGITASMTQVYYFRRHYMQKHVSAWEPYRPPTDKEDIHIRSLLKARKLKKLDGPQGYVLLALESEE